MKNWLIFLLLGFIMLSCDNKNTKYLEEEAIAAFDEMSKTIGELKACSYSINIKALKPNAEFYEVNHDVYFQGPDKMYIYTSAEDMSRAYWYNGHQFAYYNYLTATYDTLTAPGTILETIEAMHEHYGIYFPAADFFYPTFTDDMIDNFDSILYLNDEELKEGRLIDIVGLNADREVYFTLENDNMGTLPIALSIYEKAEGAQLAYEASINNWRTNPNLLDQLFNFKPRETDTRVKLEPKKQH